MHRLAATLLTQQIPRVDPAQTGSWKKRRFPMLSYPFSIQLQFRSGHNGQYLLLPRTGSAVFVDNRLIERTQELTRRWHEPGRPEGGRGSGGTGHIHKIKAVMGHDAPRRGGMTDNSRLRSKPHTAQCPENFRQMPRHYPIERPGRHGNERLLCRHGLAPVCWSRLDIESMFFPC